MPEYVAVLRFTRTWTTRKTVTAPDEYEAENVVKDLPAFAEIVDEHSFAAFGDTGVAKLVGYGADVFQVIAPDDPDDVEDRVETF